MPVYRRLHNTGSIWFFTLALHDRKLDLLTRHIVQLREAIRCIQRKHPFKIHAWVVLPDHMHCIIELPEGDAEYSLRWRLIKAMFSRSIPPGEARGASRITRGERGIWQRPFWEHRIKNERDLTAHMDYVHLNPLKHGYVSRIIDWPWSTFHHCVRAGIYPMDWLGVDSDAVNVPE